MTDAPPTSSWVATSRSAGQCATAFLRLVLRRRRWWIFVSVVEIGFALVLWLLLDEDLSLAVRATAALVYALVPTVLVTSVSLGLAHVGNRRRFAARLREGVVLESTFVEDAVVLRGPMAETTLSFDGIATVRTSGEWVFIGQVGSPVLSGWPAALFPEADLARLERSISAR